MIRISETERQVGCLQVSSSSQRPFRYFRKKGNIPGTFSYVLAFSKWASTFERTPRGDFQTLLSFPKGEAIYDFTFRFAHKYLGRGDRTVDQMIQSARSGKQNILEGSKAATTPKELEIIRTNDGRASLEELPADYRNQRPKQ